MSKHTKSLDLETVDGKIHTVEVPKKINWETTKNAIEALDVDLDNLSEHSDGEMSLQNATSSAMELYQILVNYAMQHVEEPFDSSDLTAEATGKIVAHYKPQVFDSVKKNIGQK